MSLTPENDRGQILILYQEQRKRYRPRQVSVPFSPGTPNSNGSIVAPRDNVLAIGSVVYDENNHVYLGTLQALF